MCCVVLFVIIKKDTYSIPYDSPEGRVIIGEDPLGFAAVPCALTKLRGFGSEFVASPFEVLIFLQPAGACHRPIPVGP